MRTIKVDVVDHFDDQGNPVYIKQNEKIYEIEELPLLEKLLNCKDSTKRNVNYLNIPCAFDIETTNITEPLDYQETFTDSTVYEYIKSLKIRYTKQIKADIADFEQIRRLYVGKIRLLRSEKTNIDILYLDLIEKFPEYFQEDIYNPSDQLLKILEIFDNNAPKKIDFHPYAFMYQWQFCIDDCVCFGRTWNEFMRLIARLEKGLNLSLKNRLVIYVHNLPFEWAFMNRFINYEDGFFREPRKPLKILTSEGIEFRCSYALSNMSLNKFCKNEIGVKHYKLIDTYDYEKLRTPITPLTPEEEAYCYNDVRGLCECIESRLKHDTITTIPMTATGYVRRDLRKAVKSDKKYRTLFKNNALDGKLYTMCRDAFRGGDTHANIDYSNQLLHNIHARDETSAYPACMMVDKYPMTAFTKMNVSTYLNNDTSEYAFLFEVRFINIVYTGKCGIPYIPLAKCKGYTKEDRKDLIVDNGRILYAKYVQMTITDIDLEIIQKEYTYDDIFMRNIYASVYEPLSDKIKDVVMDYYRKKTSLKGIPEQIYEYNKSKNSLNSCFGCMVMRIDQSMIYYSDSDHEYYTDDKDLEETLAKFYKSRNNFLSYQHGLWITANARKRLRSMLWKVGGDVVYCDTDSIKFSGDHDNEFEDKNKILIEEALKHGAYAETKSGKVKYMGVWENEVDNTDHGCYDEFKTLGSKKYVYSETIKGNKEITSTIAGVNKKTGSKYFTDNGIDSFAIGTTLYNSGHLTAYYNDDNIHEIIVDHCKFLTASNVALVDNTYTIGVTGEYLDLLKNAIENREDLEYI